VTPNAPPGAGFIEKIPWELHLLSTRPLQELSWLASAPGELGCLIQAPFWHSQNSFVNEVLWWMIFTARYLSPFLRISSWLKTTSDGTRTWPLQLLGSTEEVLHRHSCVATCIVDTIWIIKHFKPPMWVTYFKFYQTSSEVNLNSSSKLNNSNHQIHSSDKYQIIECKSMPSTLRLPLLLN